LIARLRGSLWVRTVTKAEARALRDRQTVFAERLSMGGVQVTIKSAAAPGDRFEPKEPDLEDVYFDAVPQADAA